MSYARRIVVISDELAVPVQQKFIEWLNSSEVGWAHWVTGGWLIGANYGGITLIDIRNKFIELAPAVQVLVFELSGIAGWQGRLNTTIIPNAQKWMSDVWGV